MARALLLTEDVTLWLLTLTPLVVFFTSFLAFCTFLSFLRLCRISSRFLRELELRDRASELELELDLELRLSDFEESSSSSDESFELLFPSSFEFELSELESLESEFAESSSLERGDELRCEDACFFEFLDETIDEELPLRLLFCCTDALDALLYTLLCCFPLLLCGA